MARALSDAEHRRIAESIRQAETATSGEIVCVVARASGDYFFPAATTALLVMLGAGLRFAQSEAHLRELLEQAGFSIDRIDNASIRSERDVPVPSLVIVASRT